MKIKIKKYIYLILKLVVSSLERIYNITCHLNSCLYCYQIIVGDSLCANCWLKLKFIPSDKCGVCGSLLKNSCVNCNFYIRSAFLYNDILSFLMLQFKYGKKYYLGSFFINNMRYIYQEKPNLLIIYIPHFAYKQITTSINSSLLLAHEFQNRFGGTIMHNLLLKTSKVRQKDAKNYKERMDNSLENYTLNRELGLKLLKNRHLVLIDDVITTGSTVMRCGYLLQSCEPASLQILSVSKVL